MRPDHLSARAEQRFAERQRFLPSHICRDEALIEMRDIVKIFENAAGKFTALNRVTTCFNAGEFVSIVGKSGSGKSTLVNMLTGIDHPTSGSVRVGDTYIHQMSENDMSLWRGANLGIVFQFFQLVPTLTLLENVMLPMALAERIPAAEREGRAQSLLELVGLGAVAEKLPAAVSGGQQQSAAIARALANDPPILIADEPTGNLDTRSADEVFDLFARLIEQGKTILMVTHDSQLARRTTRTLLLSDGELINPWIAAAFPEMGHSQLLWLTHQMKAVELGGGARLSSLGMAPGLLVVSSGELEISAAKNSRQAIRLEPGAFLCVEDLHTIAAEDLQVSAGAAQGCALLALDEAAFNGWLQHDRAAGAGLERCGSDFNRRWEPML
jgi:putative ABC transport system ATP-binding protein